MSDTKNSVSERMRGANSQEKYVNLFAKALPYCEAVDIKRRLVVLLTNQLGESTFFKTPVCNEWGRIPSAMLNVLSRIDRSLHTDRSQNDSFEESQ